jgi:hypothetical protein
MAAAPYFGYGLVALSAVLFAQHRQQWLELSSLPPRRREFVHRQLGRRCVASGLIGVIGAAMILVERVPATPLAMTAYVLALLMGGTVIFAIALADIRATQRWRHEEQLDLLAAELLKARAELPDNEARGLSAAGLSEGAKRL